MLLMKAMTIHCSIGEKILFDIPQLVIHKGDRIGLVGRNGQGKILLLNLLQNNVENDHQVEWKGACAHFKQLNEIETSDYLTGGEKTLQKLEKDYEETLQKLNKIRSEGIE